PIALAHASATRLIASAWLSSASRSARAAVMNLVGAAWVRVESEAINLSRRLDRCDAPPVTDLPSRKERATRERPPGDDARHGPDRPLLYADAARAAEPRPRARRLLAERRAGRRLCARQRRPAHVDRSRRGGRTSGDRRGRD